MVPYKAAHVYAVVCLDLGSGVSGLDVTMCMTIFMVYKH